jgi:hypothetical protein
MANGEMTINIQDTVAAIEAFFNDLLYARLPVQARQSLYQFSSWFRKGLDHAKEGKLGLAGHYFEIGERYRQHLKKEGLLWQALQNIYLPKKAYYLYKTNDQIAAEEMLYEVMGNMQKMEEQGFEDLIFGRVQQYHNLARMDFTYGRTEEAIRIVSQVLVFLLSGHSTVFTDLTISSSQYQDKFDLLTFLFIIQLFFETMVVIAKFSTDLVQKAVVFLHTVLPAARQYQPELEDARSIKRCILLFEPFYEGDYDLFCRDAEWFIADNPGLLAIPKSSLELYIGRYRNTFGAGKF